MRRYRSRRASYDMLPARQRRNVIKPASKATFAIRSAEFGIQGNVSGELPVEAPFTNILPASGSYSALFESAFRKAW